MSRVRGFVTYVTDETDEVSIIVNLPTATFNGATLEAFPPTPGVWGYNRKSLRYVLGVDDTGLKHARMTVLTASDFDDLVIGDDGFVNATGNEYTITSKVGEKQLANRIHV